MASSLLKYLKAALWFVLSLVVSCSNDTIMKYVGTSCNPWQVAFFRCLFGTLTLLPLMFYQGMTAFRTQRPWLHGVRGVLLFVAIGLWSHGIRVSPITTATIMSFTVPIFVLMLAPLLLHERVTWPMWLATLVGFGGILLVLRPSDWSLQPGTVLFMLAAALFGFLDVINKKYVTQEPMLCMLFYSNLVAAMLMIGPLVYNWQPPSQTTLLWLGVLGIGSNLVLFFILKAFALAHASTLAPLRYLELIISMGVGYLFFQELPSTSSCWGAALIIPSTLLIVYHQGRTEE